MLERLEIQLERHRRRRRVRHLIGWMAVRAVVCLGAVGLGCRAEYAAAFWFVTTITHLEGM